MIPAYIIHLAQKNAQIMRCTVIVYKYHDTYVLLPIGYEIPVQAHMLGYITRDLVFVEKEVENTNQE